MGKECKNNRSKVNIGSWEKENGFSEMARWRDGETEIEGENEIDSFYKERKRKREKEIELRIENGEWI